MKITVLIENAAPENLKAEWGLSLLIEHGGKKYLLDASASPAFIDNAKALGIELSDVDAAVLSHAHFDHSDGLDAFCDLNDRAPVYIRKGAGENCYSWHRRFPKYIGVQRGVLQKRSDRLVRVDGDYVMECGVMLIPHKASDLKQRGKAAQMYVRKGLWLFPDEFRHEHSLVFDLPTGLVVFSSCSHSGIDSILDEIAKTFPGKKVRAVVGGLHLVRTPPREVNLLAQRLLKMGVPELYIGHCTGEQAMEILERELPGHVHRMETGMIFELDGQI